jgi:CBS-domain-containing membrane protein
MSGAAEITDPAQEVVRANRARPVPEAVWSPLAAGILTLVPALVGLATGQPLLFPSLAPTAALQATQPQERSARPYSVVVGHLVGMFAAFVCLLLLGASREPALFTSHHLFPRRAFASALAVALTQLGQLPLKALHPPAAATVLLITLGGFRPTFHDATVLLVGVLIVAAAGEVVRQLRLIQPGQK